MYVVAKCLHFVMSYMKQNKKHKQTLESAQYGLEIVFQLDSNRPFPSSLVPLFQSESKCESILMKMTSICMKKKLRVELIFI